MKNLKSLTEDRKLVKLLTIPVLVFAIFLQNIGNSHASAQLQEASVLFDRIQVSTQTTGTVCAKPTTGAGAVASVAVAFPTGYTLATTALSTNWAVSTTNLAWPTGAIAWPNIAFPSGVAGQVVTFSDPATTLSTSSLYCFNWTNPAAVQITSTPGTSYTGSITTQTSVPAAIDTEQYTTDALSYDQIAVTATVPEAFTLVLSSSSDPLGNLTSSAISSTITPITVTINTNAANGWQVWAADANSGLKSPTAGGTGHTIASLGLSSVVTLGSEGYNTGLTQTTTLGATATIPTGYQGGTAGHGGGLTTTYATIASATGPSQAAVLSMTDNAAISAITPAASNYGDTITVVGGGLF